MPALVPEPGQTRQQQLDALLAGFASLPVLRGRRRDRAAVAVRREAILAAHEAGFGAMEIAGALHRDHTTVCHHLKRSRS